MKGSRGGARALMLGVVGMVALAGCTFEGEEAASSADGLASYADDEGSLDRATESDLDTSADRSSLSVSGDSAQAAGCDVTIDAEKELVIRALGVVNDPVRTKWTGSRLMAKDGAWSFGRLMANMAGPNDPEIFVRKWLSRWETERTVNGFIVPSRAIKRVIDAWPKKANGELDLTKAPMRLLAITNRFDLRNLAKGNAGEGRFVFGVTDGAGNPLSFTVILEYKLLASTRAEAKQWADAWHALGALSLGSDEYNAALERITDRFAGKNAAPSRINGSAISQLRTNEITLAAIGNEWELREFRLNKNGQLAQATVAQTPDLSLNGSATLARWVNSQEKAILSGSYVVPATFEGAPFRGGRAKMPNNPFFRWTAPGITNDEARHIVSLNTCNGCHGGETNTSFLHVRPRRTNEVASLSGFLSGGSVVRDPLTGEVRSFDETVRRRTDLKSFICSTRSTTGIVRF